MTRRRPRASALAECQRQLDAREAELAVINSVQEGLAAQLDIQAIYDLVGDKIREIFDADVVGIGLYDPERKTMSHPYMVDHGERYFPQSTSTPDQLIAYLQTNGAVLLHTYEEVQRLMVEWGVRNIGGPTPDNSHMYVPLQIGERFLGRIAVAKLPAHAFTESDVHLLQTLANSMSVALENARLYAETKRLLKETEQRAQELAIINSVQQGLAAQLDIQAIYDLVGDKIRGIFNAQAVMVSSYDPSTDLTHVRYLIEKGQRYYPEPAKPSTLGRELLQTARPMLINTVAEFEQHGVTTVPGTETSQSGVFVPLIVGNEVRGVISLQSLDRENAFDDADVRLLTTLANSMSVALENARLFTEEQQRAAELATINRVSHAFASQVELGALIQLAGDQIRETFNADVAYIALLDRGTKMIGFPYCFGESFTSIPFGEGLTSKIIESGQPLLINRDLSARRAELGATQVGAEAKSFLGVPIFIGKEAIGVVSVQSLQREGRFDENDSQLLATIAANVGVAIERARLFEQTQETRRQLSDIINFLPDAALVIDREGRVIAWNRSIEEMTGIKAQDMIGKGDYEYALPFYGERRPILIDLVSEPSEDLEKKYASIQRKGEILTGETYVSKLRGGGVYLDATASALRDANGNIAGAIELIRDITDRKHAEEELQQAKQAADSANQAKSAFLAMMSHEIRTPLNAIIGMSGLMLDTPLNPEQREYAEMIRTSGDALLTVINDVLDFSKIEAGKMEMESQPFDLRACVESALDLVAARASEKGLNLACIIEDDVPAAIVGDVTRLRQVCINLLTNAVKFTNHGEVVLTVSGSTPTPPHSPTVYGSVGARELHFSVRDTGIGIPPDRQGLLFRSFSQLDASTARKYGGTGLGLAISKRLGEMMDGTMWVESEGIPGQGSTFHFTICAQPAPDFVTKRRAASEQPQLRDKRILIVDDNATNRLILIRQTRQWGMLARDTSSPREALEWITRGDPFDVAIVDVTMPEMDGLALAAEIRKVEALRATPLPARMQIILSSSLGRREPTPDTLGIATFLLKPLRQSQLYDALATLFAPTAAVETPAPATSSLDAAMAKRLPLRILLAEDNAINQKLVLRLLSQMGYRADVAANGIEAIQAVERQPYDVVLMDVQMPEMDGLEATRQVCARWSRDARPRIIAMTANAMQGDREMCLAAGMDDYVSKPIRVHELVEALGKCPSRQKGETMPGTGVIDQTVFAALAADTGGDPAFLNELIDTYRADSLKLVEQMRAALAANNVDEFRRAAHSLKSNSANLGATTLASLAKELEMIARAGTLDGAAERLPRVEAETEKARTALEQMKK